MPSEEEKKVEEDSKSEQDEPEDRTDWHRRL